MDTKRSLFQPGDVINQRYEITGHLGQGGFAAVFEAQDLLIERAVALKILDASALQDQEDGDEDKNTERFRREAIAAARINHPSIVTIYDMGFTEKHALPFLAMERLYGHDLSDELQHHGPMAPARILPLFVKCLEGLAAGHDHKIVHKDLKPSNIFLHNPGDPQEELKILDFGIARLNDNQQNLTGTGQIFGTARYMAPEYIQSQNVTSALDVYQMGLILVELLTGRSPVGDANALACVMKHTNGDLQIPSALLRSSLGGVVLKALETKPVHRYPNARAFLEELQEVDFDALPSFAAASPAVTLAEVSASMNAPVAFSPSEHHTGPFSYDSGAFKMPVHVGSASQDQTLAGRPVPPAALATSQAMASSSANATRAHKPPPKQTPEEPKHEDLQETPTHHEPENAASSTLTSPEPLKQTQTDPTETQKAFPLIPASIAGAALIAALLGFFLLGRSPDPKHSPDPPTPLAKTPEKPVTAPPPPSPTPEKPKNEPPTPQPQASAPPPSTPDPPAPAKPAAPPPQKAVKISLNASPQKARFLENREVLGQGTLLLTFEGDKAPARTLEVVAPGYQKRRIEVKPDDNPSRTITLQKIRRTRPTPKPAPKPKPRGTRLID